MSKTYFILDESGEELALENSVVAESKGDVPVHNDAHTVYHESEVEINATRQETQDGSEVVTDVTIL